MSLLVAAQSVIYYVVACTSCRQSAYQRRRKREAAQTKLEKQRIETEQPHLYAHPTPFSTNIYWQEEIGLGPGPPQKKNGKDKKGPRGVSASATESSVVSSGCGSLGGAPEQPVHEQLSGDNWNRRRYQREDELLWGHDFSRPLRHGSAAAGSSTGAPGIDRTTTSSSEKYYYTARNPPLNELHPPVVSTPATNGETLQWMLQPPPNARIMNGKERANRLRNDSRDIRPPCRSHVSSRPDTQPVPPMAIHWAGRMESDPFVTHPGDSSSEIDENIFTNRQFRDLSDATRTSVQHHRSKKGPLPISISEDALHIPSLSDPPIYKSSAARRNHSPSSPYSPPTATPILQELRPPDSSTLNSRSGSPLRGVKPAIAAGGEGQESQESSWRDVGWAARDFDREVSSRWSMDI
ncbi:MAG: hypothetical protein M1833_006151 [Piccolia ochrophora]|nr:MAG: hypothetical protein M1833_006151 [Piccolia ochrophora]